MAKSNGSAGKSPPAASQSPSTPPTGSDRSSRPSRTLPTNRIAFQKQLDILRAFGAASEPNRRAVQLSELAGIVSLHVNTLSLSNPFFVDAEFVQRTPEGFVPAPEVVDFARAYEWNAETASRRLAPIVSRTWFAQALVPKLRFRSITETEAIQDLATAATAVPQYRPNLEFLLEYLQAAGIVNNDGGQIRLVQQSATPGAAEAAATAETPTAQVGGEQREATPIRQQALPVSTSFNSPTRGAIQFEVRVKVDMEEFAGWDPQRITAFFAGVAQVLAAKGAIEEDSTGS